MALTDRVSIPVGLQIPEAQLQKVLNDLKARFHQTFTSAEIGKGITAGGLPRGTTLTGAEEFTVGGRKFRVRAQARRLTEPTEGLSMEDITQFRASVQEVGQQVNDQIGQAAKRLRDFKRSIRHQPLQVQETLLTSFINEYGDVNNELFSKLQSVRGKINRNQLRALKQRIAGMQPANAIRAVREAVQQGDVLAEDVDNILKQLRVKARNVLQDTKAKRFKIERTRIAPFSIETQIRAYEDLLQNATWLTNPQRLDIEKRLPELRAKLARLRIRETRGSLAGLGINQRIAGWEQHLQLYGDFEGRVQETLTRLNQRRTRELNAANRQMDANIKSVARERFAAVKTRITGLPLREQIHQLRDYIRAGGEFEEEARAMMRTRQNQFADQIQQARRTQQSEARRRRRELDAARRQGESNIRAEARERFSGVKTSITGLELREQIHALRDYIRAGGEFEDEARAMIRQRRRQQRREIQSLRRQRFTQWRRGVEALDDPIQQINAIDQYLSNTRSRFADEARAMRRRVVNAQRNARAAATRDRNRDFANRALVASGIGLGALGAAGFPLLNVGFAAMSGGLPGALMVGFATALGEGTRAVHAFNQANREAAKSIGFIARESKLTEARFQTLQAFQSTGTGLIERLGIEQRIRSMRQAIAEGNVGGGLQTFIEAGKTTWNQLLTGNLLEGSGFLGNFLELRRLNTPQARLEFAEASVAGFRRQMMRPTVGIETDPYETWRRIQNSLLDPTKSEELRIQREMLRLMEEELEIFRKAANRQRNPQISHLMDVFSSSNSGGL